MPRPKKTDKKPVEKPKATAKRRKDKEEDHDDLEEFEEKPEKKLKVESKTKGNGKAKIFILTYVDRKSLGETHCGTHTFKDLDSALEFRECLRKRIEEEECENQEDVAYPGFPYFIKLSKEYVYNNDYNNGSLSIRIKEVTVDELLAGKDANMQLL